MLLDLGVGDLRSDISQIWSDQYNLPAYTPPEVLKAENQITQAADVYGIGLLMYEMLTGKPAYEYHLKKDDTVATYCKKRDI